jgi:hypothetical protein
MSPFSLLIDHLHDSSLLIEGERELIARFTPPKYTILRGALKKTSRSGEIPASDELNG